ncbi:class I tRNA ligase family protein [Mycoplasmopsis ciconiae]|uniref:Class I tRNA ligase family protein n=1 Tax=Mycoplasmopsis ciconiae TaxID=561067 RepID=A0ABU7MLZ0_9BACT|nr:class I tRNA ligase family protein [Mycoplasmopsis ciconiae]
MKKIYVCGPTVYNDPHIGNMRPIITFDIILKAARALNIDFNFVHNITDIDDKIINQALSQNKSEKEISSHYTNEYFELLKMFNVDTVTKFELVTENIDFIVEYINKLIKSQNAYLVGQNVYFDVQKNQNNYSRVSNQNLQMMKNDENDSNKKFFADFALWKDTSVGIKFDSNFGKGRPGWHTECCALIYKNFGQEGVDIHGGGMDLTFPHHENENIQHFSLFNKDLTKEWLRSGQINLNDQKMSKSLGNVLLAKDFLVQHSQNIFRIFLLLSAFNAPINISQENINNAYKYLNKIKKLKFLTLLNNFSDKNNDSTQKINELMNLIWNRNFNAFNKEINELIKEYNKSKNDLYAYICVKSFENLGIVFDEDFQKYIKIYKQWKEALSQKDYSQADKFREILIKKDLI